MKELLLVALGGALGSMGRYAISAWALADQLAWRFPVGTFLVNILGSLLIGLLGGLVVKHQWFSPEVRLLLITGVLGGFTTFSAFGLETFYLIRRGELGIAIAYVASSVLLGLILVWLGYALITQRS